MLTKGESLLDQNLAEEWGAAKSGAYLNLA